MEKSVKRLIIYAVKERNALAIEFGDNDYWDAKLIAILNANGITSISFSDDKERMDVRFPD